MRCTNTPLLYCLCVYDRVMSVSFSSSKQAAAVMSSVGEMRSELTVEPLQPTHTMSTLLMLLERLE